MALDVAQVANDRLPLEPRATKYPSMPTRRGGITRKAINTRRVPVSISGRPIYFWRLTFLTSPKPERTCLTGSSENSAG